MGKTEHRLWIGCVVIGFMTLGLALFILPMFPAHGSMDLSGYGAPIYAFEFARTPSDLIAIFGPEDDPDRITRLMMMDRGNRWDFLFMATYTTFIGLFGLATREGLGKVGSRLIAVALIAGLSDMMETRTLLAISADLQSGVFVPDGLHTLWIYVYAKFAALALSVFAVGLMLLSTQSKIWKIVGWVTLFAAILSIPALWRPDGFGSLLGLSIGIGWMIMLIYAGSRVRAG